MLVPSFPVLEQALAEARSIPELKTLHDKLEAVGHLASKMRLALADQNRIAELRIRAARKAGAILAETVHRGGNSHGGSSAPLPGGITWNQSSRWQKLATVPDELLSAFIAKATEEEEEVTVAGFLRASTASDLDVHFSSEREEWLTPPHIIAATQVVLGSIDLDPCAEAARGVPAKHHCTENEDGLGQAWSGHVYMNPPYGKAIEAWVTKLAESFEAGEVTEAVALLPSRTDTAWFRRLRIYPRCFISGRLTFSGHEHPAPFPSVVAYFGPNEQRFVEVFSKMGDCMKLIA